MILMRPTVLRRLSSVLCLLFSVFCILLLAGCTLIPEPTPDPTRYYVLSGSTADMTEMHATASANGVRVGLNGIELAPYLTGRAMVVRHGTNELSYNDYARWAEPLDAAISGLVRTHLLASPRVARVSKYPFSFDEERDYTVSITVVHCEGAEPRPTGGYVARFAATIDVTAGGSEAKRIAHRVFVAPEVPWDGKDYGALAAALSEAVRGLAREVEAALPER